MSFVAQTTGCITGNIATLMLETIQTTTFGEANGTNAEENEPMIITTKKNHSKTKNEKEKKKQNEKYGFRNKFIVC